MPQRKVNAGVLGGALGIILSWILTTRGVDVPALVGGAFSTFFGGLLAYLVPGASQDPTEG